MSNPFCDLVTARLYASLEAQQLIATLGAGLVPSSVGADYSVNSAAVDGLPDGTVVMRTGSPSNPIGAYNGGGIGNKSILGLSVLSGQPIKNLTDISFTWENILGPTGPFANPPGGPTVLTPYVNMLIDFAPLTGGDKRIVTVMDDSLNASITNSIGTYQNPGGLNTLTYSWSKSQNILIIGSPPAATPGGVVPAVTVGPLYLENSYRWADVVAANPDAIFMDFFNNDGGAPAGAIMNSLRLVSGDSANVVKSGKHILEFKLNGIKLFPL